MPLLSFLMVKSNLRPVLPCQGHLWGHLSQLSLEQRHTWQPTGHRALPGQPPLDTFGLLATEWPWVDGCSPCPGQGLGSDERLGQGSPPPLSYRGAAIPGGRTQSSRADTKRASSADWAWGAHEAPAHSGGRSGHSGTDTRMVGPRVLPRCRAPPSRYEHILGVWEHGCQGKQDPGSHRAVSNMSGKVT